ncbi:MAG: biopolymer transporter ExbD [Bacteriovoracaceae bacterium]|nr:biopolymer transporter ExbD [Bacteriovoracaceae bacterium]
MAVIGAQSLDTGNFEHHLLARSQKKKSHKKNIMVSLMLTSMVDMFSMLVCFLLITFSSNPEVNVLNGVELPKANSGVAVKEASVLAISKDELFLDQERVGSIKKLLRNPRPLARRLSKLKKNWKELHPGVEFTGTMNFQADKSVSSITISTIMGILTGQQFNIIQMATLPGGFSEKTK